MRPGLFALVVCIPFTALCQSIAPAAVTSELGRGQLATPRWTACNYLALAVSTECVSSQAESNDSIYPDLSSKSARPERALLAQNSLTPLFLQSAPKGTAKGEPIPTQWPHAKLEKIPTQWPHLAMVPIDSGSNGKVAPQPPRK